MAIVTRVLLVVASTEKLACKTAKPTRGSLLVAMLVVVVATPTA